MRRYKHYSFDLWLTLIKSNPMFKEQRDAMFFDLYNPKGIPSEKVRAIVAGQDVKANQLSESTGIHVPVEHIVGGVLNELGYVPINIDVISMIVDSIQSLFLKHPPILYDTNTRSVLEELHDDGSRLSILSNTGFIKGTTVRQFLAEINIGDIFANEYFSDELMLSKPHKRAFIQMVNSDPACRTHLLNGELIHVGDNPVADGASVLAGIPFFQINSNEKTIKDLL